MAKEDAKIIIGGDAQRAVKSLQDVSKNLGGLGNSVSSFMGTATGFLNWQTAAAAGASAVATGFATMMKDALDTADQMANMSKRTGIVVESLSKLSYVAKMSDTSMETLQKSMKFLNTSLYDVSTGNKAAIDKFKEFGVAIYNADGTVKNAEQSLIAVADAYVKLDSEAAKTALATQVFGKAGQELMPMLAEGGAGIKALTDEAERMGLVVKGPTAAAAEALNDKLDKMKTFSQGVAIQVLNDLVPAMNKLTQTMDAFNSQGQATATTADTISYALKSMATAAVWSTTGFRMVFSTISEGLKGVKSLTQGNIGDAILSFGKALTPVDDYFQNLQMTNAIWSNAGASAGLAFGNSFVQSQIQTIQNKNAPYDQKVQEILAERASGGSGGNIPPKPSTKVLTPADMLKGAQSTVKEMQLLTTRIQDSFKIEPAAILGVDPEGLTTLSNVQSTAIDIWKDYYKELDGMSMANLVLMSDATSQTFGSMGDMLISFTNQGEQQYRAMFEIGRAFKAAEIVTSTYSAAVKAYDSQVGIPIIGPYLAVAAAASAVAFGVSNLANLWSAQPGQTSISGGGVAPVPNFANRNPQGGNGGGGSKNITIKFEGFIWDKDRLAREITPALQKALSDGMGR